MSAAKAFSAEEADKEGEGEQEHNRAADSRHALSLGACLR
jgi:hypothetical protein